MDEISPGWSLVCRMLNEIEKNENHELSIKSAIEFARFFGWTALHDWENGRKGFVAHVAAEVIGRSIENGTLVIDSEHE